jgi:Fe-S-cluster containining protein
LAINYRKLKEGEIHQKGDEYLKNGRWYPYVIQIGQSCDKFGESRRPLVKKFTCKMCGSCYRVVACPILDKKTNLCHDYKNRPGICRVPADRPAEITEKACEVMRNFIKRKKHAKK